MGSTTPASAGTARSSGAIADTRAAVKLATVADEHVVEVANLRKSYGAKEAVRGVSFQVRAGEVFGVLGPNGAGKTTTLECLVGLRRATSGRLRILGSDPAAATQELRRSVAVQPQEGALFPSLKARETLALWASFYPGPADVDDVLAEVGLQDQAQCKVKALSGGQARRLLLGVTIIGRPRVLVLDEPSAGLDPQARELLWDIIRAHGHGGGSVLLSTHDMNEAAELCGRLAILVAGQIAALGTPAELVRELGIHSTVSFTTPSSPGTDRLRALPGVTAVETARAAGGFSVHVRTFSGDAVLRHIAADRALRASDISLRQGSLEEVFRKLAAAGDVPGMGGTAQ